MQAIVSEIDGATRDALTDVWGALKAVFGLPGMTGVTRPRVVFHAADEYDADRIAAALERVGRGVAPVTAVPAGLSVHRGRRVVLVLALHREGALGALHARLWRDLAPHARGARPAYAPPTWAPHITLAEGDIAGAQLDVISEFLSARPFATPVPLSGLCLLDGEAGGRPLRNVPLGRVTSL